MEKTTKKNNEIIIGLIVSIISLVGIFVTIVFPIFFSILQLIFSLLYVIGMLALTKGIIKNRTEKFYRFLFLSIGILILVSLFMPAIYNLPGIYIPDGELWRVPNLRFLSWVWDYVFVYAHDFETLDSLMILHTPNVFYVIFIIIPAISILFISLKIKQIEDIIKYGGIIRTMANFLIIFPIILYVSGVFLYRISIRFEVTIGFSFIGPFFSGILLKLVLKKFLKELELPIDDYQTKKYKLGYISTIIGGYALVIFSALIFLLSGVLEMITSSEIVNFLLNFSRTTYLIAASLAFISILCALFSPRLGVIALIVAGIFTLLFVFIISPFYLSDAIVDIPILGFVWFFHFLICLLILRDLSKTRKIRKLSK